MDDGQLSAHEPWPVSRMHSQCCGVHACPPAFCCMCLPFLMCSVHFSVAGVAAARPRALPGNNRLDLELCFCTHAHTPVHILPMAWCMRHAPSGALAVAALNASATSVVPLAARQPASHPLQYLPESMHARSSIPTSATLAAAGTPVGCCATLRCMLPLTPLPSCASAAVQMPPLLPLSCCRCWPC